MNVSRETLRPYGERGYLLELGERSTPAAWEAALAASPPPGLAEMVPGFTNLLLLFERPFPRNELEKWLQRVAPLPAGEGGSRSLEVPVIYDGPDLPEVARATGLSVDEVVARHVAPCYRVRMMGFAPGFPYLDGLDPKLHLERKASPRDRIAPGSVAIGGPHAGIYSVASPGGWHLLGRTGTPLFQPEKAREAGAGPRQIFSLAPGDTLRFRAVAAA